MYNPSNDSDLLYTMEKPSNNYSDMSIVEKKIQEIFNRTDESGKKFADDYKVEDLQVFAEITANSYYPVEFTINENKEIIIANKPEYAGLKFFIGSKKQFLRYSYTSTSSSSYRIKLPAEMKTAWNAEKFLVFINGYLVNNNILGFVIPSFDNNYAIKSIYTPIKIKRNDKVDVFYIESDDMFKKVSIAKDVKLVYKKYIAETDEQTVVKIPFPIEAFSKSSKDEFYIFNEAGEYLDRRYDYSISSDGEYIVLDKKNRLIKHGDNYIIFIFPYLQEEEDDLFVYLNLSSTRSTSYFVKQISNSTSNFVTGLLKFNLIDEDGIFNEYTVKKENVLLFKDGITDKGKLILPENFEVIDNETIQLLDSDDIATCDKHTFYMHIFNETNTTNLHYEQVKYEIKEVIIEKDSQNQFDIPKVNGEYLTFLLYYNGLILGHYNWNSIEGTEHTIILEDSSEIKKDNKLYFIFIDPKENRLNKITKFERLYFKDFKYRENLIPEELYPPEKNYAFNTKDVILFLDDAMFPSERYAVIGRHIIFDPVLIEQSKGCKTSTRRITAINVTANYHTKRIIAFIVNYNTKRNVKIKLSPYSTNPDRQKLSPTKRSVQSIIKSDTSRDIRKIITTNSHTRTGPEDDLKLPPINPWTTEQHLERIKLEIYDEENPIKYHTIRDFKHIIKSSTKRNVLMNVNYWKRDPKDQTRSPTIRDLSGSTMGNSHTKRNVIITITVEFDTERDMVIHDFELLFLRDYLNPDSIVFSPDSPKEYRDEGINIHFTEVYSKPKLFNKEEELHKYDKEEIEETEWKSRILDRKRFDMFTDINRILLELGPGVNANDVRIHATKRYVNRGDEKAKEE